MDNNKIIFNLALIFLTVASVLILRMETAQTSYEIAKYHRDYKKFENSSKILSAKYEKQIGSERMVSEASGMVAMKAPKTSQVVMISKKGFAFTR
jgi:hypothetical protein